MRPVGSGDSKFPSGLQSHFGVKPDPSPNKDLHSEEALFQRDTQAGKMMIPIPRRANQRQKTEPSASEGNPNTSGLPAYFKNFSKETFKPHLQSEKLQSLPKEEPTSHIKAKPEVRVQLGEAPGLQISNLSHAQVDPIWSQEAEGIERIPGENPDGKNTVSFSSQTGELLFWSTKGFGKIQLPDMITRKAKPTKPVDDVSDQDDDSSSEGQTPKKAQPKKSAAATKLGQRDPKMEMKLEEAGKVSSSGGLGLGKRVLRNTSPGGTAVSGITRVDPGLATAPADLNLFKQIVKLKSTMKTQDHVDLPTKFTKLKGLLNKDFSLSGSELAEVFRVENARASATKIRDFKHAENLFWRLALVLTNTGVVWLVDMADHLPPEIPGDDIWVNRIDNLLDGN